MNLLSLLIAVAAAIAPAAAFELRSFSTVARETPAFFSSTLYLSIYFFFWNVMIEVALLVMQVGKHNRFFVENHAFLAAGAVVGQLVNEILLGSLFDFENSYRAATYALILLLIAQVVLGAEVAGKVKQEELPRHIFPLKTCHKLNGLTLYFGHKLMIALYAGQYGEVVGNTKVEVAIKLGLGLSIAFQAVVALLSRTGEFNVWRLPRRRPDALSSDQHRDVLQSLQVGEYEVFAEETVRVSLSEGTKETTPRLRWALIENKVIDLNGLRHPCGQFVLAKAAFKDITRELYGLKAFRVENRRERTHATLTHKHRYRTFIELQQHCFGEISLGDLLVSSKPKQGFKTSLEDPNAAESLVADLATDRFDPFARWRIDRIFASTFSVILAAHADGEVAVNVTNYWLKNFGKYFLLKRADGSKLASHLALALSPAYLSLKKTFLASLGPDFAFLADEQLFDSDLEALRRLATISGPAQAGGPRLSLRNRDVHDRSLPLLYSPHHGLAPDEEVSVVGPIGLGLGFDKNSSKSVLIVAKDEGVYPFVDCFEFFSQKALLECLHETVAHPIFGNEYRYTYANELRLNVVLFISPAFATQARTLILNALASIDLLQKHARGSNIKKIIRQVTVVSPAKELRSENYSKLDSLSADFSALSGLVSGGDGPGADRLIVSGDPAFVDEVLANCFLPPTEVIIL